MDFIFIAYIIQIIFINVDSVNGSNRIFSEIDT